MKRATATQALFLLAAPLSSQAPRAGLPANETLHYTVEWRLITAGKARLAWNGLDPASGRAWEIGLQLESTGLVSRLFKVNNQYSSLHSADLCAESTHMMANEGSRRRETSVTFHRAEGKASYLEKDLVKNAVIGSREIDIPPCVHDVLGALYALRRQRLEPGQSTQMTVSDGKKSILARIEAQERESVKTPAGARRAVRYEAFLFNDVLYRRPGRLYFWLSDDERRTPVQIRVRLQLHVGTITLLLEKEERS